MKIKIDYDESLLALISSVAKHYGVETRHRTLPQIDEVLRKNYKNVVVMIFDGMGTAILDRHLPESSFLRRSMIGTISSVFPPTTTAATITMETGLAPIEHGWLGWSLYFDEIGQNVDIFPNTVSGTKEPAAEYHVAQKYLPFKNIFQKIAEATKNEVRAFSVSPFSDYKSRSVEEICGAVQQACAEDGRKYIYTYWYRPDYDMHDYGTAAERIAACISDINAQVEAMCKDLPDTLVIVTADHGLIDTEWLLLENYPDILQCLTRMPSIESRAISFSVKNAFIPRFQSAFEHHFGDYFLLLPKEQVLSGKIFGDGLPHPRSADFIGDFLAVAIGNVGIECHRPATRLFKAAHAGFTRDEMAVPLIVWTGNGS